MTDIRPDRILSNVPDGMQPIVLAREVEQRLKDAADAQAFAAASLILKAATCGTGFNPRACSSAVLAMTESLPSVGSHVTKISS